MYLDRNRVFFFFKEKTEKELNKDILNDCVTTSDDATKKKENSYVHI